MELREDAQARAAFEQALRLAPNNPEVLNNYGWFLCLRGERRPRHGVTSARVQADPMYTTPEKALLNAGLCARIAGRNVEAEDYLRRAVVFSPTSSARSTTSPRSRSRRAASRTPRTTSCATCAWASRPSRRSCWA